MPAIAAKCDTMSHFLTLIDLLVCPRIFFNGRNHRAPDGNVRRKNSRERGAGRTARETSRLWVAARGSWGVLELSSLRA